MSENQSDSKRVIEVNGVKMEVDLRYAKKVDHFKVGDPVKFLRKEYSDRYKTHIGVIIGFTDFKNKPAIDILYLQDDYGSPDLKVHTMTEDDENELAHFNGYEGILSMDSILEKLDRNINLKEKELEQANYKRKMFEEHFSKAYANEIVGT